jgi:pSer/pThr/pTyr-binding forkhead associated (FHA) protein
MKLILEKENGSRITIENFPYVFGRKSSCDYVLDSTVASRKHARFIVESDELFLEDLDSSNGTFVNLERINGKVKVSLKDQIKFGDVRMTVISVPES